MLPGIILFVYLGSIAQVATGGTTTAQKIPYGVGFLATLVVTIWITKIAKKHCPENLNQMTREKPNPQPSIPPSNPTTGDIPLPRLRHPRDPFHPRYNHRSNPCPPGNHHPPGKSFGSSNK